VTTRGTGSSLSSLTAFNRRLIAQTGSETVAEEATDVESSILETGTGDQGTGTGYPDPDAADAAAAEEEEVAGRFSSVDPFEFNRVKEFIEQSIFQGRSTGMTPLINAFINDWAQQWRRDAGIADTDKRMPSYNDLLNNEDFLTGASYLPFREQLDAALPPVFRTTQTDEEGNEQEVIFINNPLTGPQFIESPFRPRAEPIREVIPETAERRTLRMPDFRKSPKPGSRVQATPSETGGAPIISDEIEATPSELRGVPLTRETGPVRTIATPSERRGVPVGPFVPPDVLENILSGITSGSGSGRGSGGGGGGGERDIVFDREHLIAQVAEKWQRWMLDPNQPPLDWIGNEVDNYVRDARAFWQTGGQLDFDTYMTNKLKKHPRYEHIYKWKGAAESEEQFLQKFVQPITQLGMTSEFTRSQAEGAVTSGAGPAEQLQRITRTPEVQASGGFSRRLAQTLAGIGVG
jgi:hypothetical protein